MSAVETGGPAFPTEVGPVEDGYMVQTGNQQWTHPGMTLRDHIAIKEMASAQRFHFYLNDSECAKNLAKHCYMMADAMLEARK